jgi:ATP-dependent RNA helicase DDX10/DBP4
MKKPVNNKKISRSVLIKKNIDAIEKTIQEQAPKHGTNLLSIPAASSAEPQPTFATARKFDDLPLSQATKDSLRDAKYITMTAIQRAAIPHALCSRDILGAAKTGSGKTLAFLIPLVDRLYRLQWSKLDGLGALIISPTRELALQIFEELRKVGKKHDLSAGLLIGGKNVDEEKDRVNGMNILVCTPGRLLQHMDETPGFDAMQLQVLVLDEADRILDMGFSATLNAIVANLPTERQTMLFSATQTKTVSDLARLSLKDPEYVSVHQDAEAPTPVKLEQAYMVCELQEKMDILWSFIKAHLKCKVIIFLSTCKQVRFAFELFRRLRPGIPLRALHGKMNQYKRMGAFYEFCEAKSMVLFATDIAARGLDFPTVDWVVQADCPENIQSYIHRVGRTARYVSGGRGLLLLLPSEKDGMLAQLEATHIPVKQLKHNPDKIQPITPALQALLSKDQQLKEIAQRSVVSYLRSVFLQPNRQVFDVTKLPADEYAFSLGLPSVPKLRFLKRGGNKDEKKKNDSNGDSAGKNEEEEDIDDGSASSSSDDEEEDQEPEDVNRHQTSSDNNGDDLLVVKRHNVFDIANEAAAAAKQQSQDDVYIPTSSAKKKKVKINPTKLATTRVVFDEEGQATDPLALLASGGSHYYTNRRGGEDEEEGLDVGVYTTAAERAAAARKVMVERDATDKDEMRALRKAKRDGKRAKRLARERDDDDMQPGGRVAALASRDGNDGGGMEEGRGGYSSSSEKEDDHKDDKVEAAHMDMRILPDLGHPPAKKKAKRVNPSTMSLQEQEDLALQLLQN